VDPKRSGEGGYPKIKRERSHTKLYFNHHGIGEMGRLACPEVVNDSGREEEMDGQKDKMAGGEELGGRWLDGPILSTRRGEPKRN